jgi:hypothetical protein
MLAVETIRCVADAMRHLFPHDPAGGGHEQDGH